MSRFIKLFDSITGWEWYNDIYTARLFIHLLLKANYKESRWRGETVERGQLITSRNKLSLETCMTEQQVRTALDKLKKTGEIKISSTSQYSLVTLVNWALYQGSTEKFPSEQPANQPAINQHSNQQSTSETITGCNDSTETAQQINQHHVDISTSNSTTLIELKNIEDKYSSLFQEFWKAYPRIGEKQSAYKCWQTRLKEGHNPNELIGAAHHYAAECASKDTQFIKLAKTFIGPNKPFLDHLEPAEPAQQLSSLPDDAEAPWQIIEDMLNQDGES